MSRTIVLCAILIIIMIYAGATLVPAAELLTNPGIETGNTSGWSVNGAGTIAVSTAQKHAGTYSLLHTGRTATWNGPLQNLTSKVQSGTTYTCSGWVRLDNAASGSMIMTIKKTDGGGTVYTNIASGTGNNSSWVQLSGSYTLSVSGTLTELSIYFEGPAGGVNYYLDDVSVSTGTTATPTPTLVATATPTPTPTATPLPNGTYVKFRNVATNFYIDGMGSTANGSNACQYSSSSSNNQQWTIVTSGSYVMIQNRATGLYLDGMGSTANGSVCCQYSYSGSNNQQWTQEAYGSNVRFKNRATGLYLDGMGSTANGSNLCQYSSSGSTNQQWQIVNTTATPTPIPTVTPTVNPNATPTPTPTATPSSTPVADIWNLPALPIASGPYQANYDSLKTYYTPAWFRDAKLGMWQHWDPQSVSEQGDWYAKGMYQQGSAQYNYHVSHYGHPSAFGYKDICNLFKATQWDPDALMDVYINTGGKYVACLANHHDNYDMWNSKYQPWNVMNVGPKKDIVGLFAAAAKKRGLRFGLTFHASPPRTWGQFMPVKYGSDSGGQYDGLMTKAEGAGKWWNGMDPKDLYGSKHNATDPSLTSPFANQFMWRVDDAITKYHPDLIYFDEHAGYGNVDLGVTMGLDFLSPQICANLYNKAYAWNGGILDDVVCAMKGIGGIYNSFPDAAKLEKAYHSMLPDTEKYVEATIQDYPFQIDYGLGDWHYRVGMGFASSATVIHDLLDIVAKGGNLLLCLPTHGDGHLEPASVTICNEIGAWLKQNGEAIYGSRTFAVSQETAANIWFTRRAGYVYAITTVWPSNNQLVLSSLKKGGTTIGNIQKVEFLGNGSSLGFSQTTTNLTISCPSSHTNSQAYAFRITHDKPWENDDDPGTKYTGYWRHQANRNLGDYNNDVWSTQISGATCEYTFTGTGIDYISEKNSDMGNVDVYIDGVFKQNVNLYSGSRLVQQVVYSITGLASGSHTIKIVNKSTSYGMVDAFKIY